MPTTTRAVRRGSPLVDMGILLFIGLLLYRKQRFGTQVKTLTIMQAALARLTQAGGHLPLLVLQRELARKLPNENPHTQIQRLIDWGRHAELMDYDVDTGILSLRRTQVSAALPSRAD